MEPTWSFVISALLDERQLGAAQMPHREMGQ